MTIPKQLLEAKICNKNTCELQKRINKAIAFLETKKYYVTVMYDNVYEKKEELLDILKGGEENEK